MTNPRKKPRFRREEAFKRKKVPKNWRKPRGRASKLRRKEKHKPKLPNPGFGAPTELRGLHPSMHEVHLVHNKNQIKDEWEAIKIASVGKRKKRSIVKHCVDQGIKILNVRDPQKYLEKTRKKKREKKEKKLAKPEKKPKKKEKKPKKGEGKKEEEGKELGSKKKSPIKKTSKRTFNEK